MAGEPVLSILGGGQLGQMLAMAARPLGVVCRFLDPNADCCASRAGEVVVGPFEPGPHVDELLRGASAVTYEFENVPAELADAVANAGLAPSAESLRVSQDRLRERELFESLGIGVPVWRRVDGPADLERAMEVIGRRAVLKTRRMGYDGKGQARLSPGDDAGAAWDAIGGRPAVVDSFIDFRREVSVIVARDAGGRCVVYPVNENVHDRGILRKTVAPAADAPGEVAGEAAEVAVRIAEALGHVGVLTVELFDTAEGLVANEIAPRVHNSGHWTIEGTSCSQFENHVRAVLGVGMGRELVEPELVGPSAMVNIVGREPTAAERAGIDAAGGALHLYGKSEKPGRKLGHVTVVADTDGARDERVSAVEPLCPFELAV